MKKLMLLLIVVLSVFAANAQWQQTSTLVSSNSVEAPFITSLIVSGSTIFAGSGRGLFKSNDYGATWTPITNGFNSYPSYPSIIALAADGATMVASAQVDSAAYWTTLGVYLSTNSGESWTLVGYNLQAFNENSLAVKDSNIYVGTANEGLMVSHDLGRSWTGTTVGAWSIAISGNAVCASNSGGPFLSTDSGNTWTKLPFPATGGWALAMSGDTIFATSNSNGLYLSSDQGASWIEMNNGYPANSFNQLIASGSNLFARVDGSGLWNYGGVYLSTNNGANWTTLGTNFVDSVAVMSIAILGSNIFAGTDYHGVWRMPFAGLVDCTAHFTLYPDNITPHQWYALSQSTGSSPISYIWNWGDGTPPDTAQTPAHIYTDSGYYNICLTVNDGTGCSSNYCSASTYIRSAENTYINVNVVTTLPSTAGLPEVQNAKSISIYPNPTTGKVYFSGVQTGYTLQVYNVLGEIISSSTVDRDNYAINLSGKAKGMYFYRVTDAEKQVQQGKIVLTAP